MHYCRSLRFEDRPDYGYLKKMFKDLMVKLNHDYDYMFDWTLTDTPKRLMVQGDSPDTKKRTNLFLKSA